MLEYSEITERKYIILDNEPWEVIDSHVFRKQQRKPVNATKLRNLITGRVTERSFHVSEKVEEAEIDKMPMMFLYENRGNYWFCEKGNPKNRISFKVEQIADQAKYLKPNTEVMAYKFGEKIINIELPVKIDYKVVEAPPSYKGDTATGGSKTVVLENGLQIQVPMFINVDDIIRVNTSTGEYTERAEKK